MQSFLSEGSMLIAQKSLDALWLRQKVISDNIANIDTPGYKSKTVAFEQTLITAVATLSQDEEQFCSAIEKISPQIRSNNSTQMREDGNNVDIDAENIELTRVQLQYEYMARALSSELSRMKIAITEGRA